mmetsp:Transcript_74227/g.172178  ORF Transcript_74227/g.172178 Transcript_74227/m.172178 type:complete len:125 (+) Transcript_74227:253-627(+)
MRLRIDALPQCAEPDFGTSALKHLGGGVHVPMKWSTELPAMEQELVEERPRGRYAKTRVARPGGAQGAVVEYPLDAVEGAVVECPLDDVDAEEPNGKRIFCRGGRMLSSKEEYEMGSRKSVPRM